MTADPRWSILPAYLVRTAGFAFDRLAALRCARAAAAAAALDLAADARRQAGQAFDEALAQERFAEYPAFDDPAVRKAFSRQVKQARAFAKQLADAAPPGEALREVARVVPRIAPRVDALDQAHAGWQAARREFAAIFAEDFERARAAIRRLYQDDERLQEAVFLESPEAFERIRQLIASAGPRNVRARQRERLAVMYAQRFCAKNDTNSFCGPHGVAYVTDEAGDARLELVTEDARRQTYFSQWAAQQLLDAAVRRAGDAAPVTLQLHPTARVGAGAVAWCLMDHDATTAFRRRYARSALAPGAEALVRALARPHTPAQLTAIGAELGFDAEDLTAFVDELIEAGLVLRGPVLAPGAFHPLRAVAGELARWPAGDARDWAIAELAAVEALVDGFARAALPARLELFATLAARYQEATGGSAARGQGQHYADRSLLHEDCYVEVRAALGPARAALDTALPVLMRALELPLELARERVHAWFRARFGEGVRVAALDVHRAFDEDRVLEAPATTARAERLRAAIERVRELIARAAAAGGPIRLASEALRAALADVPPPDRAGYVSADLMLARAADGQVTPVLGEVHGFYWLPTCLLDVLPPDHRDRVLEQMRAAVGDMAQGRRTAEAVFLHTQATDRRYRIAATDLEMLVPSGGADAITLGRLDVRLAGDTIEFWSGDEEIIPLVAYTRYPFLLYTSRIAPLLDDFAEKFFPDSLLPAALRDGDAPRLVIDDLVIRRRQWRRPAPELRAALVGAAPVGAALVGASEAELFRRGQALQRELGCGPVVFASLPGEPKPVLLDFQNVFLLEALVNLLDGQPADAFVKLTEMVPGPGELVARAADGARTAELRMGFYRTPAGGLTTSTTA